MVSAVQAGHDGTNAIGGQAADISTTWLELEPDGDEGKNTAAAEARNPFNSLGDIAVAVTAKRPLPGSLEEYRRTKEEELRIVDSGSRSIADAAVLVRVPKRRTARSRGQQALCTTFSRDEPKNALSTLHWLAVPSDELRVKNPKQQQGYNSINTMHCMFFCAPGAEVNVTCRDL